MSSAYYFLVHQPVRDQIRQVEETAGRLILRSLRYHVRRDAETAKLELRKLAALIVEFGFAQPGLDTAIRQHEATRTFYRKFTVLDLKGRILARPSEPDSVGEDRSDRPYFSETLRKRKFHVTAVRASGRGLSQTMAVPIITDGVVRGVLAGHVALNGPNPRLCQSLFGVELQSDYKALLLSREGFKIAHSRFPLNARRLSEVDYRDHPMFVEPGERTKSRPYTYRGVRYVGFSSTLSEPGWELILEAPEGPILARVGSIANRLGVLFGVAFLLVLALVTFYGSRIVRPITRLTSALVEFGKAGKSEALAETNPAGEVGEAIAAFNQMIVERTIAESESLRHRDELRALANELARLEQRTRNAIASELHDHISQNLAATKIRLEMLRNEQTSDGREDSLQIAIDLLRECIQATSHLTERLAQPALKQLGLVKALDALITQYASRHEVDFSFREEDVEHLVGEKLIEEEVAEMVYRGVSELLHNVVKHARARQASVRLSRTAHGIMVKVRDDGVGLSEDAFAPRQGQDGGFGLFDFRERVRQLGGSFDIESGRGRGCTVTIVVPLRNVDDMLGTG